MEINEFIDNYLNNNVNGSYSKEQNIKKNYPHIYKIINDSINLDIDFKEKLYLYVNKIEKKKCENCGKYTKFINNKIGYRNTCSNSCSTKINRYKIEETLLQTKGVKHHSQLPEFIEKSRQKKIDKIKNIVGKNNFIYFDNGIIKYTCDKCNSQHETLYTVYSQRVQLDLDYRDCVTGYMNGKSNGEKELQEYIQKVYTGKILLNHRKILNGLELDIYLPELQIAIEYNGLYWHSELNKPKNYHRNKYEQCIEKEIKLIQIYEDEWLYKRDIVESRLLSVLGIIKNRIYARNCIIKEISFNMAKEFLNKNHLQGSINSSINIGLFYNNDLVSLMTFGRPRKGLKYKSDSLYIYELYRFCNALNSVVIGGASKIFKYFLNQYKVDEVFSYSSMEWPGTVYEKIGFKLNNESSESYWFINGKTRISRHNYNRHSLSKLGFDKSIKLSEIYKKLKLIKIYGCGNKRFIYKINI